MGSLDLIFPGVEDARRCGVREVVDSTATYAINVKAGSRNVL